MAIISCDCKGNKEGNAAARFQDARYGNGRRVATEGKGKFTCTVCGKEHK